MIRSNCSNIAGLVVALFLVSALALAQITFGTVTGQVVDPSGHILIWAGVLVGNRKVE
jgi:protein-S-isoprenylcysteine O-methyltransferase Ste14